MMRALTLLQVSDWPVARIAEEVGYESASRFTARFRQRFGFLPTAVRGQKKTAVGNRCSGTYRGMPQHLIQGGKQNYDGYETVWFQRPYRTVNFASPNALARVKKPTSAGVAFASTFGNLLIFNAVSLKT